MEVTHNADHITHAVIGGEEAIDFGISDSPEFFQILSSTLYTDQKLAVVRETLCNAWDSHVESGRTDVPIQVSTDTGYFIIRDYGNGIAKQNIGRIYGTYGNSTKKKDGKQTGGFGLGCKAPFAYQDHFEVTSCNAGTKTVYRISKSSAEVGGKPSIKPILSIPTKETGLTVKIKINQGDEGTFFSLAKRIIRNGEMRAILNEKEVELTVPFTMAQHGFTILHQDNPTGYSDVLQLRYGHVIYPIPEHEELKSERAMILDVLKRMSTHNYSSEYRIIFQAPPHSITVTPSRESLSMQEHTVGTIKTLFNDFLNLVQSGIKGESYKVLNRQLSTFINSGKYGTVIGQLNQIPGLSPQAESKDIIQDVPTIATRTVARHYPNFTGFAYDDLVKRVKMIASTGFGDKTVWHDYLKHIKHMHINGISTRSSGSWSYIHKDGYNWFHKRIIRPLIARLDKHSELSVDRMFLWGYGQSHYERYTEHETVSILECGNQDAEDYFNILRKIVVLNYNRTKLIDRLKAVPWIREGGFSTSNMFLYVCPRSEKKIKAAREFFIAQGYTVIDFTKWNTWETEPPKLVKVEEDKVPARKRRKGFPRMDYALTPAGHTDFSRVKEVCYEGSECPYILEPEWYSTIPKKNKQGHTDKDLPGLTVNETMYLLKLWGNVGAVVNTSKQIEELREKGIPDARDFVAKKLVEYMVTSHEIQDYISYSRSMHMKHQSFEVRQRMELFYKVPELMSHFGIVVPKMSQEAKRVLALYEAFRSRSQYLRHSYKELANLVTCVNRVKMNASLERVIDFCTRTHTFDIFDVGNIIESLQDKDPKHVYRNQKILEVVTKALF